MYITCLSRKLINNIKNDFFLNVDIFEVDYV